MKIVAIIQARMGSSRLPGKVLTNLHGVPLLQWLIERAKCAPSLDEIVVATSEAPENKSIVDWVAGLDDPVVQSFVGSENDVLERYYLAAKVHNADLVVRLTADDPLKDPQIIEEALARLLSEQGCDYCSNTIEPSYPEGLDVEVFTFEALSRAHHEATLPSEREHVTPYIWKQPELFKCRQFYLGRNLSNWRWTIDTQHDFIVIEKILSKYATNRKVGFLDLISHVENSQSLLALMQDRNTERNEGYFESLKKEASETNE